MLALEAVKLPFLDYQICVCFRVQCFQKRPQEKGQGMHCPDDVTLQNYQLHCECHSTYLMLSHSISLAIPLHFIFYLFISIMKGNCFITEEKKCTQENLDSFSSCTTFCSEVPDINFEGIYKGKFFLAHDHLLCGGCFSIEIIYRSGINS